jgi:hypothetical protein
VWSKGLIGGLIMEKYIDKIIEILDNASCNESADDYSMILQEIIDECQGRFETVDYGEYDYD